MWTRARIKAHLWGRKKCATLNAEWTCTGKGLSVPSYALYVYKCFFALKPLPELAQWSCQGLDGTGQLRTWCPVVNRRKCFRGHATEVYRVCDWKCSGKRNIWPRNQKILHEAKIQNGKIRTTNHVLFERKIIVSYIYHVRIVWARNSWMHIWLWEIKIVCKECVNGLQREKNRQDTNTFKTKAHIDISVYGVCTSDATAKNVCGGEEMIPKSRGFHPGTRPAASTGSRPAPRWRRR